MRTGRITVLSGGDMRGSSACYSAVLSIAAGGGVLTIVARGCGVPGSANAVTVLYMKLARVQFENGQDMFQRTTRGSAALAMWLEWGPVGSEPAWCVPVVVP